MDSDTKTRFTDEEWRDLAVGPVAAASAMLATSKPGVLGIVKEGYAGMKATKSGASTEEAAALVSDILAYAEAHDDLGASLSTDGSDSAATRSAALDAIDRADAAAAKLSPQELHGYAGWLVGIARAMAETAPDKGEDTKVSLAEEETIAEIERRLGRG